MPSRSAENVLLIAWRETRARFSDRPAIFDAAGATCRTFEDIESEACAIIPMLAGLPRKAVVGIRLGNHPRWPALLLALFRSELIPLPLGQHMESGELAAALAICGAAALVEPQGDGIRINADFDAGSRKFPDADFLKLTSGTTSAPRAVRFRAEHLLADCEQICTTMGFGPDDLNFGAIPFSHSYGYSNLLTPLLCRGVPLVATDNRLPRALLDGLAATGATVFPGIPVFFQKLSDLESAPALPALRLCISAGAPLPPSVGERFTARFGLKVHTFYGASECGGIAYDRSSEPIYREGFVGGAMSGVSLSPLEDGRISVSGPTVGDGYFPDEDAALESGCFVPGDLVEWSERGLTIVGRASDVINVAGRKLSPACVEQCLLEIPGVRQAVLFGVPCKFRGEEAVACVAGEGIDAAAILRACRERLSPWQVPRDVWIVPEISANERGKISRRQLAAQYLATRCRS